MILSLSFFFLSCKKKETTKDEMMKEFVENYNSQKTKIENSTVVFENSEQTSPNEITLNFSSALSSETIQPQLIKKAITDLMIQIIRKNPKNIHLLNKGVNFKIQLTGKNGKKIATEIVNKSSMTSKKPDFSQNEKHQQLNQLLEVSNSNLPVTDPSSGVKITKVFLGTNNDVIYNAEVPDKMKEIIKTSENQSIIKKNMSKDKAFIKMVKELKAFDIKSVKYQYRDQSGKLLQEVEVTQNDVK